MMFAELTQEDQDIGNKFRLQMAKIHARTAKSTWAATAKIGYTIRPIRTSPPTREANFMESNSNTGERLFLSDADQFINPENSINTYDPSKICLTWNDTRNDFCWWVLGINTNRGSLRPRTWHKKIPIPLEWDGKRKPIPHVLFVSVVISRQI